MPTQSTTRPAPAIVWTNGENIVSCVPPPNRKLNRRNTAQALCHWIIDGGSRAAYQKLLEQRHPKAALRQERQGFDRMVEKVWRSASGIRKNIRRGELSRAG